ncbi:hypothetical protein SFC10_01530 [Streptococcus ruminicola]|uniref:hypothetical protein n=1 Tax=Streptococcus ruminicola TaxID=2686210 RepID=UPI003981C791
MTLFGIFWVVYLLYCFSKKGMYHMFFALSLSMVLQCDNVFLFGSIGIGPQITTSIFFILFFLIKNQFKFSIQKENGLTLVGLSMLLFPIFISLNNQNCIRIIMLLFYIVCSVVVVGVAKYLTYDELYDILYKVSMIVLVIGFLQIPMTMGVIPKLWLFKNFIYNDVSSSQFYIFNSFSYIRFFSTFQEPSYCAPFLIAMFFFFIESGRKTRENTRICIILLLAIILTFSSTAYGCFSILIVIWLLGSYNFILKKYILPIIFVGLVFFLTVGHSIIENVLISKMESGSGLVRAQWNNFALQTFYNNIVVGGGYKTARASSLFYCLLGELGLVGLTGYILFNVGLIVKSRRRLIRQESLMLLTGVVSMMIACPDLDLCSYWLIVYIVKLLTQIKNKYEKDNLA